MRAETLKLYRSAMSAMDLSFYFNRRPDTLQEAKREIYVAELLGCSLSTRKIREIIIAMETLEQHYDPPKARKRIPRAYNLFFKEVAVSIEGGIVEKSKVIYHRWQSMSEMEKLSYEQRAMELEKNYL